MKLPEPMHHGILLKRYKRFLADIRLRDGTEITAHCPNTGRMKGCDIPGSPVILSRSNNPKRKLPFTWELVKTNDTWVGINTHLPNKLVIEAITEEKIPGLTGFKQLRREVPYAENSRIDILLENDARKCYVEVKNVTLAIGGAAAFPDAVTKRGQKHLRDLMQMVKSGHRSVIFFLINRGDVTRFTPADDVDPVYGKLLREAVKFGVEALACQTLITPPIIKVAHPVPILL